VIRRIEAPYLSPQIASLAPRRKPDPRSPWSERAWRWPARGYCSRASRAPSPSSGAFRRETLTARALALAPGHRPRRCRLRHCPSRASVSHLSSSPSPWRTLRTIACFVVPWWAVRCKERSRAHDGRNRAAESAAKLPFDVSASSAGGKHDNTSPAPLGSLEKRCRLAWVLKFV